MRTRHRVAGILAIAVLAIALPASAEPPGMTAPTNPPPAGPDAGPGAGPTTATGQAGAESMERQGPFVTFGLDAAAQGAIVGDVQLGWMLAPWIGVFLSVDGLVVEDTAGHLWGAGLRLAGGAVFAEARILSVGSDRECDDGCGDAPRLALFGAGFEIVRSQHVALDLHLRVLTDGRDAVPLAGLGLGFHF